MNSTRVHNNLILLLLLSLLVLLLKPQSQVRFGVRRRPPGFNVENKIREDAFGFELSYVRTGPLDASTLNSGVKGGGRNFILMGLCSCTSTVSLGLLQRCTCRGAHVVAIFWQEDSSAGPRTPGPRHLVSRRQTSRRRFTSAMRTFTCTPLQYHKLPKI